MSKSEWQLLDICNDKGEVLHAAWLARAEGVHRQLRSRLPQGQEYSDKLVRALRAGARMTVAHDGEQVLGVAIWRSYEDTHDGIKFYIDDIVTDEAHRLRGIGSSLLAALEDKARAFGATNLVLDVGVQRHETQRFCFREGFSIISHSFKKPLV
ncbi:GNAT family N-acetyltransferase [Uliginosibacterium sp. H3]|uniref:GNAT family N-acetyltransferase n=1 Tax=Uliginosibacterium silvisoli TaxID=3114758 RepID=A0ABU6K6M2_9RHOO|nr:GNAT family N-acetyltransferase [Uliginosibacterium sp. H3]